MSSFDNYIDRHNTESYKWDFFKDPPGVIPMPVADMDFRCPEPVLHALNEVTEHGIMGYTIIPEKLRELFRERLKDRYNWNTEVDWQVWIPGLIPALTSVCTMIGNKDDEIITPIPAYYPIHLAPGRVGKQLVSVPMIEERDRWVIDYDALKTCITNKTRLFVLCNPHNPGGTVFTKDELSKLAAICEQHRLTICSDEIHCDLILDQRRGHTSIASLSEFATLNSITLMAPSKTFNVAGLGCSVAIIPNASLRKQFESLRDSLFPFLSRYAVKAAIAAYEKCEPWRQDLIRYLNGNHDYLIREINTIPGLRMLPLEATYLAWIQCERPDFSERLLKNGVRVIDGGTYLKKGFFRLNFACPRSVLETAVARIKATAPR